MLATTIDGKFQMLCSMRHPIIGVLLAVFRDGCAWSAEVGRKLSFAARFISSSVHPSVGNRLHSPASLRRACRHRLGSVGRHRHAPAACPHGANLVRQIGSRRLQRLANHDCAFVIARSSAAGRLRFLKDFAPITLIARNSRPDVSQGRRHRSPPLRISSVCPKRGAGQVTDASSGVRVPPPSAPKCSSKRRASICDGPL